MNVSEGRRTKSPAALTRVFKVMALTMPPWGHIITVELLRRFATFAPCAAAVRGRLHDGPGRRLGLLLEMVRRASDSRWRQICAGALLDDVSQLMRQKTTPLRRGRRISARCKNHIAS